MLEPLELELDALRSANMYNLIPSHLLDNYKDDLNDKILPSLVENLDLIITSIEAHNSFKVLSLNENKCEEMSIDEPDSIFNYNENHTKNKQTSAMLIDIATRLYQILEKYNQQIFTFLELFNQQEQMCMSLNTNINIEFATRQDLLVFQRAIFVQKLKTKHYQLLNLLFRNVFDFFQKVNSDDEANEASGDENDENKSATIDDDCATSDPNKQILIDKFHNINIILFNLELFDHLCGDIVVEVVEHKIQKHVEVTSIDNYEESFIEPFEKWLEKIVIGWIKLIYSSSNQYTPSNPNLTKEKFDQYLNNYQKQLAHFMYTHYGNIRIKRLFDIIIDFPDSKNAIEDLKVCLAKTNLRSQVISCLKMSIEQRLLHPGVNTSDILTAYVSAIKALLCLDSSGIIMENVCEPLKKYLRNRDDTIKCIISNLTDDGESSNDLMEEFCKDLYTNDLCLDVIDSNTAAPMQATQNEITIHERSNEHNTNVGKVKAWQLWQPDPIDAVNTAFDNNNLGSKSNIISMLVNIYGSKDMFVNEYKTLLGDRLLSNYSFNMEKEIRNLELLKLRFGDSNLFSCEAMLKDISESKRINSNILEQLKQKSVERIESFEVNASTLKCIILSEQFWPKLKEEKIEMPSELKLIQEKFMSSYEAFKGNRTLIWKNNLGQVTIDVEINKQKLEFNVTPVQAAILIKFQEKDSWSILELSQSLKMCSLALRKKLFFWKMQGLIRLETNNQNFAPESDKADINNEIYTLIKETGKLNKSKTILEDDEENEKATQSNILKEQDLNLYWNYTQSMLRGCGCLPLDRIHVWLKLYANPDLTIEQVKYLIDIKLKEQLLKYNAGLYRLNR